MPNDKKPKPSSRPSASTLRSIIKNPKMVEGLGKVFLTASGVMSPIRKVGQSVLNRMSENLDPYNYGDRANNRSLGTRLFETVFLNKKEPARAETEQFIEKGYGMKPDVGFKERVDLLQMLANKPQKYNTILPSPYAPTVGANSMKTKYYMSPSLEEEILKDLALGDKKIMSEKDIMDIVVPRASIDKDTGKPMIDIGGVTTTVPGLGQATYGAKRDEKGRLYLSYSDKWDLDPREGVSAEDKKMSLFNIRTMGDLKDYGIGLGTDIVSTAASPTRVYGRIYFDPKTGKPLKNTPAKMPADRIKKVLPRKSNSK
jgi:hypothetical protein